MIGKLALLGLGVLILTEAGLRLGAGLGTPPLAERMEGVEYLPVPGVYHRFGNRVAINSLGLRAPEPGEEEFRILLIGDSVVYGMHVLDQSETMAARLTAHLGARGCAALVLPVAASSWGPPNQAAWFQRYGLQGADRAVLVVSAHDLIDVPRFDDAPIPYRETPPFSALADAVAAAWARWQAAPAPHPLSGPERISVVRLAVAGMLERFATAAIPATLVFHPSGVGAAEAPAQARFFAMAAAGGAETVDMEPALAAGGGPDALYRDAIHLNAAGADLYARAIADLVCDGVCCPAG